MSLFAAFDAVIGAAHATIEGLAALLSPLAGGTAAAVAIVLFTVAVRLLISPLSYLQIRNERRRAALAPRLTDLQHKHRDDPATLVSATFALYRANGAGPMTGLLPGLVQAPFFMIMYRVALNAPAGSFLGVPLSAHLFAGVPAFRGDTPLSLALKQIRERPPAPREHEAAIPEYLEQTYFVFGGLVVFWGHNPMARLSSSICGAALFAKWVEAVKQNARHSPDGAIFKGNSQDTRLQSFDPNAPAITDHLYPPARKSSRIYPTISTGHRSSITRDQLIARFRVPSQGGGENFLITNVIT